MKKILSVTVLLGMICFQSLAQSTGTHNGHKWVDLGLSVKWATCNIGALTPGGYGNYYAWGEMSVKSDYSITNSASYGKEDWGDISGDPGRDAARAQWGGKWRLPTKSEFQELIVNSTWTWTTQNGHSGYLVTSDKNGQTIFLPAAGWRLGNESGYVGSYGSYWSSSPGEEYAFDACGLFFFEGYRNVSLDSRRYGRSMRPVLGE